MKILYKYLLIILRWMPMLLALCAISADISQYFLIDLWIINLIGGVSIIPLAFIFIASYAFKFCPYHRIPLYYIVFNLTTSVITTIWDIPIADISYLMISIVAFGIMMTCFIISKYSICKN